VKLTAHRYGKSRVRLMKVLRDGDVHTVKELTARVLLEGDFDRCFTDADNSQVVATDTMKNTLQVLAHERLGLDSEPFAHDIATHFRRRYPQVSRIVVRLDERPWTRLNGHPHAFRQLDAARPFTRLVAGADSTRHESGIRNLIVLKSTGSGFERFHRDDLTTLPETADRILASAIRATWQWQSQSPVAPAAGWQAANRAIVDAMLVPFAERYSPSVQATLYDMARAALDACPEITRITLAMPNLHYLPLDLSPFGRTNRQELFLPTDEPHGYIEATITR
jgi:urate oxidase